MTKSFSERAIKGAKIRSGKAPNLVGLPRKVREGLQEVLARGLLLAWTELRATERAVEEIAADVA